MSDSLIEQITVNVDIFIVWKTKLDRSFPRRLFLTNGYSESFRVDQNSQRAGLILYVRKDIFRIEIHSMQG